MTDFSKHSLDEFLALLASEAPAPGGGTAAAVAGAIGASLAEMVCVLTLSKEKYASAHDGMRRIGEAARRTRGELLRLAREDAQAYDAVVAARRLPKDSPEQKAERARRLAEANQQATEVPMRTARAAVALLTNLPELVESGNPNAASDAGSAALLLEAATEGALLNVGINLSGVADTTLVGQMQRETADLQTEAQRLRDQVVAAVRSKF